MSPNKAIVNSNGFIELSFVGSQDYNSALEISLAGSKLAADCRKKHNSVKVLVNLSTVGWVSADARRVAAKYMRQSKDDIIAIYGSNSFVERVAKFAVQAVGRTKQIKFFDNRLDAENWLKSDGKIVVVEDSIDVETSDLQNYHFYVRKKISQLQEAISFAVIGEYSKDLPIPEESDEFMDLFVGLKVLLQTLEEKRAKLAEKEINLNLKDLPTDNK